MPESGGERRWPDHNALSASLALHSGEPAMLERRISGKALASLVLVALSCVLWVYTNLPALAVGIASLVLADLALWDIGRSQGRIRGRLLALAAIVLEAVAMVVFLFLVPAVVRVREAAQRMNST
jgi:hypothetical protein